MNHWWVEHGVVGGHSCDRKFELLTLRKACVYPPYPTYGKQEGIINKILLLFYNYNTSMLHMYSTILNLIIWKAIGFFSLFKYLNFLQEFHIVYSRNISIFCDYRLTSSCDTFFKKWMYILRSLFRYMNILIILLNKNCPVRFIFEIIKD